MKETGESRWKYKISWGEWHLAKDNWFRLYPNSWTSFTTFLGTQDYLQTGPHIWTTELAHKKIKLLSSPHYRTLMQVFIIQTGYHKKLPQE